MSPKAAPEEPVVKMLPPSFAVYLEKAIFVPVLIGPGTSPSSPVVCVPPLVIAGNVVRIHWCLLNSDLDKAYEFALRSSDWPQGAIKFKNVSNDIVPFLGSMFEINPTQIAMDKFTLGLDISKYDLYFRPQGAPPGSEITVAIDADPSVAITPDPVEIPSWP